MLCVRVRARVRSFRSRLVVAEDVGGFSGEQLPWKRAPVSVVLPQQYRRRGRWREWCVCDLGGRGRGGGNREKERDRARLKGHWIWSVCCTAGLEQTVRWLLLVLEILEYLGRVGNVLNPLEKSFELEAVLGRVYSKKGQVCLSTHFELNIWPFSIL